MGIRLALVVELLLSSLAIGKILAQEIPDTPYAGGSSTQPNSRRGPDVARNPTVVIGLRGDIDDFSCDQFVQRVNKAKAMGAKTIIIDFNTNGGLVIAALDLSRTLKGLSGAGIYTIAYVDTKAYSAGAMLALACREIVMADSAVIGDCAPIALRSDHTLEPLPPPERSKAESPILADFYDSAVRNGHDPVLARAMVTIAVVAHWVQSPTGQRRFVDEATYKELKSQGWISVPGAPDPINQDGTLLTMFTDLAVKTGLASGHASSVGDLAAGRQLTITEDMEPNLSEHVLGVLNTDWVRMLLIIVVSVCLYIVLHAPGHGAAEAVGLLALGLLLGVPLLTGYATWWELAIIFAGLALVAFELFVLPHTGAMVIVGLLMMIVGLLLTFVGAEPSGPGLMPRFQGTWMAFEHGVFYTMSGLVCAVLLMAWFGRNLPQLPFLNRLVLTTTSGGGSLAVDATAPIAPSVSWPKTGMLGRAVTMLKPGGTAEFYDETHADSRIVSVVSESGFLAAGTPVMVKDVDGSSVKVRSV